MKRKLLILIIIFLSISSCYSQDSKNSIKLNYNVCDSLLKDAWEKEDFITEICLINYFLSFDSTKAYLYFNRSLDKIKLHDLDGACEDRKLAMHLDPKYQKDNFYKFVCNEEYRIKELQKDYYPDQVLDKNNKYRPTYTEKDTIRGKLGQQRSCYDVYYYDLSVRIFPNNKSIQGHTIIWFDVKNNTDLIQVDLTESLHVDSIIYQDRALDFSRKFDAIYIKFNEELLQNTKNKISVYYSGKPHEAVKPPWQGGFVWSHDYSSKDFISVCCEHLGASCWWPNKDHLSDKPDSMKISIDVPDKDKVISNGFLAAEFYVEDGYRRFIWKISYPIVNYGVTFYCGNYETVDDSIKINGDNLKINYYVLPKHRSKATELFKQSREVLKIYSELFGPYPFPKDGFALVESPYEGMEHQGAIAFGDDFKKRRKVYDNSTYDYIIVHEIAHEWWGNSVSFSDMADAWLSEGFATYSELLFMEKEYGYLQYRKELRRIMGYIYNFWPIVGNYDVNENTFASEDIYNKGAIVLHNLRCLINNDAIFLKLLRDFNQKYKYQSVTTKSFTEMATLYSNLNLEPFFDKFLYSSQPPILTYNLLIDNNDIIFIYKWSNVKPGFIMPFEVSDNNGNLYSLSGLADVSNRRIENAKSIKFMNFLTDNLQKDNVLYTYFNTKFDPELKLN